MISVFEGHYTTYDVQGDIKTVSGDHIQAATSATSRYIAEVRDPKAALITSYGGTPGQV